MKRGDFEWDQNEIWLSNEGRGPDKARILAVARGVAFMESWSREGGRKHLFEIPVRFLFSGECGWRRSLAPSNPEAPKESK